MENSIVNKKINKLLVLDEYRKGRKRYCKVKCDCGNEKVVEYFNLISGHTASCGCLQENPMYKNLIGKRFGKLIVLEQIDKKDLNGHKHYLCKCDCGNIVEVLGSNLLYKQTASCGCLKKLSIYTSKKPITNKSGVKGVYFDNTSQKWVASITVNKKKKRTYHLLFADAVKSRKKLEEIYHLPIIEQYQ